MVRKTVGYDAKAHPVYNVIGYFPTRAEAMLALAQYNTDPYDVDLAKSTMKEIYDAWSKESFPTMKESMKNSMVAAYKHCSNVHSKIYKDLRKGHMQSCIDSCGKGYSTRNNIKLLFRKLDDYAYDHDIISKKYASGLNAGDTEESDIHTLVADQEVMNLWKHRGEPFVDETLFMLYTGCRVSEMLRMRCANINFDDNTMTGGVKTSYGKNRTIPIHPDILQLVKDHYNTDNTYLFQFRTNQDTDAFTHWFRPKWEKEMHGLGFNHLTHDCRHTVRSKLDSAGANKVAIDRIIGHSPSSVGEKVYTHKSVKELHEAIKLLTYGTLRSSA